MKLTRSRSRHPWEELEDVEYFSVLSHDALRHTRRYVDEVDVPEGATLQRQGMAAPMVCDGLAVESMRLLYRRELAGETFYELLAAGVDNEDAAGLLRKNGREERGHAERVRRAIGSKLGREYQPEGDDLVPLKVELPD